MDAALLTKLTQPDKVRNILTNVVSVPITAKMEDTRRDEYICT